MSDWGWVTFAYTIVYLTLGAYLVSLRVRRRRLGRDRDSR